MVVGDKMWWGNVVWKWGGVNPFPPRLQPLLIDKKYIREHRMFINSSRRNVRGDLETRGIVRIFTI